MTAKTRPRRLPAGVEIALAAAVGAGTFAVLAILLAGTQSVTFAVAIGVVSIATVIGVGRAFGTAYAAPLAIAVLVAYDWYEFPPTHPRAMPDTEDLLNLLAYLAGGVLVGEIGAFASRRAERSEAARAELADEQAALRRVATLVAQGVAAEVLFGAVVRELGLLLGADSTYLARYESDGNAVGVAGWSPNGGHHLPIGMRFIPEGDNVTARVLQTRRPVRVDSYEPSSSDPVVAMLHERGLYASVGSPIVVDGRLQGVLVASSRTRGRPLPAGTEARIVAFSELVATALSNADARAETERLTDEQVALRRVATLVAQGVPPENLFAAVARELGQLLGVDAAYMARYEPDGTAVGVAGWSRAGEHLPSGTRSPPRGSNVQSLVWERRAPARLDTYPDPGDRIAAMLHERGIHASAGAPIVVDGRMWGVLVASSKVPGRPLPPDTEARIVAFSELVATAVSNSDARAQTERLTGEQAALRRVATLVAQGSPPEEIFATVAEEFGRLLGVDDMRMARFEEGGERCVIVGSWGAFDDGMGVGKEMDVGGENVASIVLRTAAPARVDDFSSADGPIGEIARGAGVRSAVGAPILVDGRVWGAMIAASGSPAPLPPDTEVRLGQFTDLVATAISNIQTRADLDASRARLVEATDEERRRVVRDLHDGAQQRLVHTVIALKLALRALDRGEDQAPALMRDGITQAEAAMDELRELAHGILPSVLTSGGLRAGVASLVSRMTVPVDIEIEGGRLPPAVEATAYFVVAETLTNVAKHSHASRATVSAHVGDGALEVVVSDDGVGGAEAGGSGLQGLTDRLSVMNGQLRIDSPPGGGTVVTAEIPIAAAARRQG
jgi:signal transduction histidine kinase